MKQLVYRSADAEGPRGEAVIPGDTAVVVLTVVKGRDNSEGFEQATID